MGQVRSLDICYITRSYGIVERMPEERNVKKCLRISQKEKSLLESQEKDGWTMLKTIEEKGYQRLDKNSYGWRRLEIDPEGDQGPAWAVGPVKRKERNCVIYTGQLVLSGQKNTSYQWYEPAPGRVLYCDVRDVRFVSLEMWEGMMGWVCSCNECYVMSNFVTYRFNCCSYSGEIWQVVMCRLCNKGGHCVRRNSATYSARLLLLCQ